MTFRRASLTAATLTLALAAALGAPAALANGLAGDYLAGRQALFAGDYAAAANHYGRATQVAPDNPEILERAVLSNVAIGEIDRGAEIADDMAEQGFASQIAFMAQIARAAHAERYTDVLTAIREDRGLGPLADGLVQAWSQLGEGDMTAALVEFDEVAKVQGLGPFSVYHKALALASVGDFESANALFDGNGAGGMENTRRGVMARVEILSQLGQNADALALLDTAFGQDVDPGLQSMRAALENDETLAFSHVRSARDGIAEVFYTLATALSGDQNDDLTLIYARLAIHLRPSHVDALLLTGELLEDMAQFDLAIALYDRVPDDHPSYHAAELGRAEALRRQANFDEAAAVLEALTETHGTLPVVQSTLGDLYRQMERYADATAAYSTALDLYSEVGERQWFLLYARAITYERQDLWEQAEADFRRALELNPDQPQVLNYLGYSLVQKEIKLDEALDMIQRAVSARPDSGYIVDSLGWVLYRLGRYEEAVPHMERAAELMPIDPIVNDHLGDVYWAVGRTLEAEFQWKRALSFVDYEDAAEEADSDRIRRKLEVGLDQVLAEEGAPPLREANAAD